MKKRSLGSPTVIAALALFAMLFGAGNLVFPIKLGMRTGATLPMGLAGFFDLRCRIATSWPSRHLAL